jgi:hypothetical protein
MSNTTTVFTEEGQRMWDNLANITAQVKVAARRPKPPKLNKIVFDPTKVELEFLKIEIDKMIKNSKLVIKDCNTLMGKYKTAGEYLASEPKIVKTIHENIILRLERIRTNLPAFENELHLG